MAKWTTESQPFGTNRAPLLTGLASDGSGVPIPVAVDPVTGRLLTNSTGGAAAATVALNDGVSTSTLGTVVHLTNSNPLAVEIVDGSGTQITSFGGGTQYTDAGTPPAHPIGPTLEFNNAGAWATVGSATPLPVSLTSTTITGTVAVTESGTWNVGLSAGSNLVGKVGIDQTTLGTTNNVSVSGSSGAGTSNLLKDDTQFGDGVTTGILSATNRLWNGTNYDRAYGDKTNGAFVNVKVLPATPAGTNAIGTVGTTSAAINVGQQTVSTTAVQLSASSTIPTNGIIVQALSTNAASIFVGGSGVTTSNGFELVAGQAMSFSCNLNTLFIRSAASTTDKACWNVL